MRRRQGNVGWMEFKIYLEKTYDRLHWFFIKDTILDIGLSQFFIELIWFCISTSKIRVLCNEEALEEFSPTLGIQHSDIISSYLFILSMERLFWLIKVVVDKKKKSFASYSIVKRRFLVVSLGLRRWPFSFCNNRGKSNWDHIFYSWSFLQKLKVEGE